MLKKITPLMLFLVLLSSCMANKRSKCPSYAQSDPKKIFGQQTVKESLKEMDEMPVKAFETVPGLGKKKKRRRKNARLF